jgi:hypothetical protein
MRSQTRAFGTFLIINLGRSRAFSPWQPSCNSYGNHFSDSRTSTTSWRKQGITAMKSKHFWIDLVMFPAGIACALALLLACLGAFAAVAAEPNPPQIPQPGTAQTPIQTHGPQQVYEGMITCSRCGARHSAEFGRTAGDCSRVCVRAGAQFALVEGEKTYVLDGDLTLVRKLAGQRARIIGATSGNTIQVSSAAAAI